MPEEVQWMNDDQHTPLFQTPFTRNERRERIYAFPEYLILDALIALYCSGVGPKIELRMLKIPEGSTIERVHHEPMNNQFLVAISHPSFDVVPEGCPAPNADRAEYWNNSTPITITRG